MSSKVTVVVPTHNRPEMLERALNSVPIGIQTLTIDSYGDVEKCWGDDVSLHIPDNGSGPSVLSWYVGAQLASTEYVCILFDDDWYDPGFIESMVGLLDMGCAWAFCESTIRCADGTSRPNLRLGGSRGALSARDVLVMLRRLPLTITPACCMFRRTTILDHLHVGRIPGTSARGLVGPDKLLLLLACAGSEAVGWDPAPLVNLGAHEGSTTIHEMSTHDGAQRLVEDYAAVVRYFDHLPWCVA